MDEDGDDDRNDIRMTREEVQDDEDVDTLYLEPAAYSRSGRAKWQSTGRTMMAAVSPVGGDVVAWTAHKVCRNSCRARRGRYS